MRITLIALLVTSLLAPWCGSEGAAIFCEAPHNVMEAQRERDLNFVGEIHSLEALVRTRIKFLRDHCATASERERELKGLLPYGELKVPQLSTGTSTRRPQECSIMVAPHGILFSAPTSVHGKWGIINVSRVYSVVFAESPQQLCEQNVGKDSQYEPFFEIVAKLRNKALLTAYRSNAVRISNSIEADLNTIKMEAIRIAKRRSYNCLLDGNKIFEGADSSEEFVDITDEVLRIMSRRHAKHTQP